MRGPRKLVIAAAALLLAAPAHARAALVATGPDDICPPAADPCIIDQHYEVQAPGGLLDFGLRAVHIVAGGQLTRTVNMLCGALLIEIGELTTAINTSEGAGESGSLTVRARRACSGNGITPCFEDSFCSSMALGSCSVGDGTITTTGRLRSKGNPGGRVVLEATGDVTVDGTVTVNGSTFAADAGEIDIRSLTGSVTINGKLNGSAGAAVPYYTEPSFAAEVAIEAATDITIAGKLELNGGTAACELEMEAGRDILIERDISCDAGSIAYATGGTIELTAGRNLVIADVGAGGGAGTRLSASGGTAQPKYYYYGPPGSGGYLTFFAGAIDVGKNVVLEAHTAHGGGEAPCAYGGEIGLYTDGGPVTFDGTIQARGRSRCTSGGFIEVDTTPYGGIYFGRSANVDISGKVGGYLNLDTGGPVTFYGAVSVLGRPLNSVQGPYSYGYYYSGYGGFMDIDGAGDVIFGGQLAGGGDAGAPENLFDVCRLTLTDDARINNTRGEYNGEYFDPGDNRFRIRESMYAAPGSRVFASVLGDDPAANVIEFRDANKPPVLLGKIEPPPDLVLSPGLGGCPVCGNAEIDQGESCDDGNATSGDGCRDDCQDEGCIADTPGFPGVALCDDGDACTIDSCDPVGHACVHVLDCGEGVACTVDTCASGACLNTPDDALCDDGNACTDDMCSAATGCVYTNLTGTSCDDGDLCTVTDLCQGGTCEATDESLAGLTRIKAKLRPGVDDDLLRVRSDLRLVDFTSLPTLTGLMMELFDAGGASIFDASIPAGEFEDTSGGAGTRFRFKDRAGQVASANGVVQVKIKVIASRGVARVKIKMQGTEIPGAQGQEELTLSLLFGADPSSDVCLTARDVPCKARPTRTNCSD